MSTQQWIAMIVCLAVGALFVKGSSRWRDVKRDGGWNLKYRIAGIALLAIPPAVVVLRLVV